MNITKTQDIKNVKLCALIYAQPGTGKTTALGKLPGKTLIIDIDRSTGVLAGNPGDIDIVRIKTDLSNFNEVITELEGGHQYNNICLDNLSELEHQMLTAYGRAGKNDGAPELSHYNKTQFKVVDYVRRIRELPGNIFFTAWEDMKEVISLTGEKYNLISPRLSGKTADSICGLCNIVARLEINKEGNREFRQDKIQTIYAKNQTNKDLNEIIFGGNK